MRTHGCDASSDSEFSTSEDAGRGVRSRSCSPPGRRLSPVSAPFLPCSLPATLCAGSDSSPALSPFASPCGSDLPAAVLASSTWTLGDRDDTPRHMGGAVQRALRSQNLQRFHTGLSSGWGARELPVMASPPPAGASRVLAVRHGMGRHNDLRGAVSAVNRDAGLNAAGREQARTMADALCQFGVASDLDLVVVSPFKRTLEMAALMLGPRATSSSTCVQPLCAEHTLRRSAVQRGDRGSTVDELTRAFPAEEFPQYDFGTVRTYCSERNIEDGRWWRHGAGEWCESPGSFAARSVAFRRWLGRETSERGARHTLLVSHGGLLCEAFGWPAPQNSECRVVDIWPDGSYRFPGLALSPPPGLGAFGCTAVVGIEGSVKHANGKVYYKVSVDEGKTVLRRYSEFLALRRDLEKKGLDAFAAFFPPKRSARSSRCAKLWAWLHRVVSVHDDELLDAFLEQGGVKGSGPAELAPASDQRRCSLRFMWRRRGTQGGA